MQQAYDFEKIKFGTDAATYERALDLYLTGKVSRLQDSPNGYNAAVRGTQLYRVFVSAKHFDRGNCNCYLGEQGILCKHMVAVAIAATTQGKSLDSADFERTDTIVCSGRKGQLSDDELMIVKQDANAAIRLIKYYSGPSRTWFAYQNSLDEGCNRLGALVSGLPVSRQTCKLIVGALIKIDKKLSGGVDDSNGTVGGCIQQVVVVLQEFARLDPDCINEFYRLTLNPTCFDWDVPLVELINARDHGRAI